jgi:hypothetical protein
MFAVVIVAGSVATTVAEVLDGETYAGLREPADLRDDAAIRFGIVKAIFTDAGAFGVVVAFATGASVDAGATWFPPPAHPAMPSPASRPQKTETVTRRRFMPGTCVRRAGYPRSLESKLV